MRCEVCGREIRGPPFRKVIEGAKVMVCEQCAPFGDSEWTPAKPKQPPKERPRRSEFESLERLELVDDYGERIRLARQKANMSIEELAKRIAEKESVVKNLERQELVPSEPLVKKIRNILKIDLLVPAEPASVPRSPKPTEGRVLSDLIKLKSASDEKPEKSKGG